MDEGLAAQLAATGYEAAEVAMARTVAAKGARCVSLCLLSACKGWVISGSVSASSGEYTLCGVCVCMGALSDCAIPLRSGSSEQHGTDMEMGSKAQHASVPPSPERWGVESQSTNRYLITPFCPLPHEPMLRWSIHRRWHTEKKLRAGG